MTWNDFIKELNKHPHMLDTEALLYLDDLADVQFNEPIPLEGVIERYEDDPFNEDNDLVTFIADKF